MVALMPLLQVNTRFALLQNIVRSLLLFGWWPVTGDLRVVQVFKYSRNSSSLRDHLSTFRLQTRMLCINILIHRTFHIDLGTPWHLYYHVQLSCSGRSDETRRELQHIFFNVFHRDCKFIFSITVPVSGEIYESESVTDQPLAMVPGAY